MRIIKIIVFVLTLSIFSTSYTQNSRIELTTINSTVLGINKNFNIYLPAGYDSTNQRYPVIYLFRGHEREWANRSEDGSRAGRNIQDIADQLYQNGEIGKIILVMPGLTSNDNTIHGLGVNMVDVGLAGGAPGLGTGLFQDYVINELMPYVDTHYRTLPTRAQRASDGFSFGGYTSMMMVTRHPELFISAGAYDGALMWLDFDDLRSAGQWDDRFLNEPFFDPVFGLPRDTTEMISYNSANLLFYADSVKLSKFQDIQFMLHTVGSVHGNLYALTQHFVTLLNSKGIQNSFSDIKLAPTAVHNWWYADEHILKTLPLHWQKFQNPTITNITMQLLHPLAGSEVSGNVEIRWSSSISDSSTFTVIEYSRNEGNSWNYLTELSAIETTYLWNTINFQDGTRYLLRIRTIGDTLFGEAQSQARFTVNNPGNGLPDIELLAPSIGEIVSGNFNINWFGDDADDDALSFSMDYSTDNGLIWSTLFSGLQDSFSYSWNSVQFQNGPSYRLVLHCWDGSESVSDTSKLFEVFNQRIVTNDSTASHVSGIGSGKVIVNIVNPDSLTGDPYRITFDDSSYSHTVYNVENLSSTNLIVQNSSVLDGITEGPFFQGLRLIINDYKSPRVNEDDSGWLIGTSDLEIGIYLPTIDLGGSNILNGFPYSADYRITLYNQIVDTSSNAWGALPIPAKFTVINETENKSTDFIFIDNDSDNSISRLDEIYILETDSVGGPLLTWAFAFGGQSSAVNPVPGDEYFFATLKPFTHEDIFEFSNVTSIDPITLSSPNKFYLYQNYPNPFNPTTKIKFTLQKSEKVKLQVFNLLGQKVVTLLNKTMSSGSHVVELSAKNLASGIYFYEIRAAEYQEVKKMILLK